MADSNRSSEVETQVNRVLEKSIRRSRAVDTESLCIIAGKLCWSIRADVHVLENDGNLTDAACVAVMAGLIHFKKPDTTVNGEEATIVG